MNKPIKAALFSALIFPGAGQLLLKKYVSAIYFAVFAGVGLYFLFSNLMSRTQDIIDKVQRGEVSADLATITELVNQQSSTAADSLSPALIILLVVWLVSVVEAYRVGKKEASL
jgi:TM2 domain-containing membrane protein YozV